jgi:hypothetical protein
MYDLPNFLAPAGDRPRTFIEIDGLPRRRQLTSR